jgi:F-type H+-transporting ATPase subunit b
LVPILSTFATSTPAQGGLFDALGIDWKMLILQIIAFLLLVWLLGKFVYPWLIKSVDERQAGIDAVMKAANEAKVTALHTEAQVEKLLEKARLDASDIVATAKIESVAALAASEEKAKKRSDQIIADAQAEIHKEVVAAKAALHNETIDLIALATEKVVGKTLSGKIDNELIKDTLEAIK